MSCSEELQQQLDSGFVEVSLLGATCRTTTAMNLHHKQLGESEVFLSRSGSVDAFSLCRQAQVLLGCLHIAV